MAVRRIGNRAAVAGHPFVDGHGHSGPNVVVRSARRCVIKFFAFGRRAVQESAVGPIGVDKVVVQIIDDGGLVAGQPGQRDGTAHGRDREAGMQFVADRFTAVAVHIHNEELAGVERRSGGKGPLREVGIIVGQIIAAQADRAGAAVVKFDPGMMVTEPVLNPADVVRLHFVQPEQRQG